MPLESKITNLAKERLAPDPNEVEMPGNGVSAPEKPSHEEIAVLAFEYYQLREGNAGDEVQDWLRAERDLVERASSSADAHPSVKAVSA